jgi:3-hydroxypropionyl-CoA synthetase (ADP-forming)
VIVMLPVLQDCGFNLPRGGIARNADEAVALAAQLGGPVAMKILSPDILHKTDVGGVALGLTGEAAVRTAFDRMMAAVAEKAPAARIEGVTVEEMVSGGVEVIIGLTNDAQFGPALMFGLGGIFAEILHDVSFRLLPLTERDAREMIAEIKSRPLLTGFRGQPAVSEKLLVDLLLRAARLGEALGDRLETVDLNPVLVWGDQHCVLDARFVLKPPASDAPIAQGGLPTAGRPNVAHLEKFFAPRSVAVVGASATPGKIGNAVLDCLTRHEYRGQVYPINPTRPEVMGLPTWPSLAAIPEPVDLVVVTVALAMVPDILRECAAKGVHNVVIISGGGKELGGASQALEAEIKRLARELDVRVIGPNCIGVFDGETRLDVTFQVRERMVRPAFGPIAILVQSGTVGAAVLEAIASVGVSRLVSYGNRVDVDEADLATYLADDPGTQVLAYYVEGLADGRKFVTAAAEVGRKKPIVIFKAGRTPQAAAASISHTGFFGGTYAVAAGAFKQAGMIAVESIEELAAVSRALALQPPARGHRVAMISNGAGTMVQAMDLFEQYGLSLGKLTDATVARLRQVYPPFYLAQNPVDVTGSATSADYEVGIEALLADPGVDVVMPWFVFQDTPLDEEIVAKLGRLSRQRIKPILCGGMGGPYTEKMSRAIEAAGVPVYRTVREWVAAAGALARRGG